MFDWLREIAKMRRRGLKRVVIVEKDKRGSPIDVIRFLSSGFTESREINSAAEIMSSLLWVANHIKYQPEEKDFWKFPDETIRDGSGDCEDGAILLACLLLASKMEVDSTGVWRHIPYYKVLVNVYETPAHVAVTLDDGLLDWTNPTLKTVPDSWKLWYCFNRKHAYTTRENAEIWKK